MDRAIAAADALLASLPPAADGDPVIARHADALAAARAGWAGYLSTTGVYGDRRGGWADEEDALEPSGERGRGRVAAEAAWTATGLPVHHFRLAGIYGPGRSVLDRLRAGRAQRVVKPGQVFSRIHVADIAAVLAASLARPDPGRAYNVADDLPAPPEIVIDYAAGLLGMRVPPTVAFEDAQLAAAGTKLLAGIEAGREPADQGGAPGLARLPRLSGRTAGGPRGWRVSHSRRKSGWRSQSTLAFAGPLLQGLPKAGERPEGRTTR